MKGVNLATGRESAKALAFGDTNWGEKSRLYMSSVMTLSSRSWDKFIEAVQPHLKARLAGSGRSKASVVLMDEDKASDQRAQLIDLSDDDSKCRHAPLDAQLMLWCNRLIICAVAGPDSTRDDSQFNL